MVTDARQQVVDLGAGITVDRQAEAIGLEPVWGDADRSRGEHSVRGRWHGQEHPCPAGFRPVVEPEDGHGSRGARDCPARFFNAEIAEVYTEVGER